MEATIQQPNFFMRLMQYYNLNALNNQSKVNCCIDFNLPYNSNVNLNIFDLSGKLVKTVYNNKFLKEGFYSQKIDLTNLLPGEYYYELETDRNKEIKYLKHSGKYSKN
ncbi:MAG TPA: hypothetical protein DIS94_04575 [Bacteroidetes bacterium]|nr:hypothetical protein [Bacteroidota bacterium]